jgi:hypothetical protein
MHQPRRAAHKEGVGFGHGQVVHALNGVDELHAQHCAVLTTRVPHLLARLQIPRPHPAGF